jgi:hypothetical protein
MKKMKWAGAVLAGALLLSCKLPMETKVADPYAGKTMVSDSAGIVLGFVTDEATRTSTFLTSTGYAVVYDKVNDLVGVGNVFFTQEECTGTAFADSTETGVAGYMVMLRDDYTIGWTPQGAPLKWVPCVMASVDAEGRGIADPSIAEWKSTVYGGFDAKGWNFRNSRRHGVPCAVAYRMVKATMASVGLPETITMPLVFTRR